MLKASLLTPPGAIRAHGFSGALVPLFYGLAWQQIQEKHFPDEFDRYEARVC